MIDYRFVPLSSWPGKRTPSPKAGSPFRVGYGKVLSDLERELRHLGAKECLFEAELRPDQIRLDGRIRAGERAARPGMVVSFLGKYGPLRVACDRFRANEDNLRAISLHLEHLRLASLYGVGEEGQQYQGWAQLPASDPNEKRTAAIAFISSVTGWPSSQIVSDPDGAYRLAASALHPDRGGSHDRFVLLQQHREALK